MTDSEQYEQGYCESGLSACRGGRRGVRKYNGLLICDRCWPHRRRAPGRRKPKEEEETEL